MNTDQTYQQLARLKLQGTQLYLKLAKLRYTAYVEQVSCKPDRGITSE
jgi:hypothetical protein